MVLGAARAAVARLLPLKRQINAARLARDIWQFQRRGLGLEDAS
jgi:hypothetical protein